jgi:hypothetical protein
MANQEIEAVRPFVGRLGRGYAYVILLGMGAQGSDDGQRRDALLRRLLKAPLLSRAEPAEAVRRAKGEPPQTWQKRASENSGREN